jgi:hypothetical protein
MPPIPRRPFATPPDPSGIQRDSGRHGTTGDQRRRGEFGTVLAYQSDRYTATVRTERGRTLRGVPRLRSSPGEVVPLAVGTEVAISFDYGMPLIVGVITMPGDSNAESEAFAISDVDGVGGDGPNGATIPMGNFRGAAEPRDVIPGDWVQAGRQGNMMGVLEGGTNVIRSGPLAQIRTHLLNDLVELLSRNFRQVSDMGEFTIMNTDGRINMRFRGATDQRSEAGPDEERWTVKFDLGAEGDMLNFEICTPEGQTLFKWRVTSDGHCELYGVNGIALNSGSRAGGGHAEEHTGDSVRRVSGSRTSTTAGDETRQVDGNSATTVASDYAVSAGNDGRVQALRDLALSAGRNAFFSVQGGDGDAALTFDIESGDWVTTIGSTSSPDSGYKLSTFAGDIEFESSQGGDFNVTTQMGNIKTNSQSIKLVTSQLDSVVLGGENLVSHLVKYEELQQHLIQLYTALDMHTHLISGTATAGMLPVNGTTGMPVVPIGSPIQGSMQQFKSTKAGVSS